MSTQSQPNTQSRANAATLRNLHHMCLGSGHSPLPVIRVDCMCLHGRPCVWLPFAAACGYTLFYLLMMPAARLVCQRPSSNFPYFRTPLANFLLSRSNSVEYGNSKTTTLLPSAKCTRPFFQRRTGCGGRLSGWHDIVTCQRLVKFMIVLLLLSMHDRDVWCIESHDPGKVVICTTLCRDPQTLGGSHKKTLITR